MIDWLRKRALPTRILVYAVAAVLAFALAAGVGAMGALMLRGDLGLPRAEEPQPSEEQGNAPQPQEKDAAGQQNEAGQQQDAPAAQQKDAAAEQKQAEEAAAQQSEAEYLARVGDIQSNAVETFLDSHNKLLRYDALGADDVEKMQANEAALRGLITQVDDLDPPQGYE
jgi:hypothetical protein